MSARNRPTPKNVETPLKIDELFFSKTDLKGIILDGNEVFYRIAKYSREELIGKPHNIVRHPDMPRVVFKLLWEYIQNDRPFAGYVKNLAKDGSYYWVFAVVVPVYNDEGEKEKYLSIRIKPTSKLFPIVKELYKKLRKIEEETGSMEESERELIESIKAMGYQDYTAFMTEALIEELSDKDEPLNVDIPKDKFKGRLAQLYSIYKTSKKIENIYKSIFHKVNAFVNLEKDLEDKFRYIYEITDELSLIALNSSVESYKLGSTGASFFVVSSEIKKDSERIGKLVNGLRNDMRKLLNIVKDSVLYMNISRLEIFAILYFINEIVEEYHRGHEETFNEDMDNLIDLLKALKASSAETNKLAIHLADYLKKTLNYIDEIESIIKELHYIQLNGLVESARLGEQKFSIIFNQVKELVENTTKLIEEILPMIKHSIKDANDVEYIATRVIKDIDHMLEICNEGCMAA